VDDNVIMFVVYNMHLDLRTHRNRKDSSIPGKGLHLHSAICVQPYVLS
jgi:hypothetical protein